jgi:hypothetical protein
VKESKGSKKGKESKKGKNDFLPFLLSLPFLLHFANIAKPIPEPSTERRNLCRYQWEKPERYRASAQVETFCRRVYQRQRMTFGLSPTSAYNLPAFLKPISARHSSSSTQYPARRNSMDSWKKLEEHLRQIINIVIRFIKAQRREEASITFGAFLIWAGVSLPEWLEKVGLKEFVASWYGDKIGRGILITAGAGLVLYAAFKFFRLVYVPDLPPPQDRPSAIKGPMAFTEGDGALFRKLGRETDLQKLLGLILDNQVVMVVVRQSERNIPASLVELKF